MPTAEECAYAAGFLDGEGCIYVRGPHGKAPHRSSYSICVGLGNDDIRPILFIQRLWGGSISPGPVRANGKCNSRWTVTAKRATAFLQDVLPFLKVKREQAELVLELQTTKRKVGPWQPLDEEVVERWAEIKKSVAVLNARYPGYYDVIGAK